LRALSARHLATLAAIPDIIMEVDNHKVYTWANQAGLKFFGEDVIGREAAFYFEGEQETYQIVQPIFNGKDDVIYVESWQRRHDGEKRLLAWWCRTLKDAQGNVTGALSTAHDITERKRTEAALKEYSERLAQMVDERTRELRDAQDQLLRQERLTVLGQLAGGISHELRSPLGAIKNALYLLKLGQPSPDSETAEILQILEKQVAQSEHVITSLMDFARPQPPHRRATDVRDTIDLALAQSALPANIVVQREFAENLPELQADPDQLQIVFGNLIRNAAQAMPEGGTLTITARANMSFRAEREIYLPKERDFSLQKARLEMTFLEITFRDTGVGIAPEELDKIFQPMFTTKSRGMGLGLALCKLLVEGHNGKIQVTSQVGKGTTFTVVLPMGG
jgi:PAS domain S-box-containing protein